MAEGHFGPLPLSDGEFPLRRGKFIDIETFGLKVTNIASTGGTFVGGDIYSDNWISGGGTVPLSLASRDASATAGYGLDGSAGGAQFVNIFADAGELRNLTILGNLTLGTGGVFRTAASGERVELSFSGSNTLTLYSGDDDEATTSLLAFERVGTQQQTGAYLRTFLTTGSLNVNGNDVIMELRGVSRDDSTRDGSWHVDTRNAGAMAGVVQTLLFQKGKLYNENGSEDDPAYTFASDPDTGMYRSGTNQIGFTTNGSTVVKMGGGGTAGFLIVSDGALDDQDPRLQSNGGSGAPAYSFRGDPDTGMYRVGTNQLGFTAGGAKLVSILGTGGTDRGMYLFSTQTTGDTANLQRNGSTGQVRIETSARKYKSRINYNVDYLADIDLKPAKFYRKDDKKWFIGFIAEDFGNQNNLIATYDSENEIENYDSRAVMAVMAAKINRLEKRLEELEK